MMTKEGGEELPKLNIAKFARSYTQINNEDINIEDLYSLIYQKIFPMVFNLLKKHNANLSKYENILTNLPKGYSLPFELKVEYVVSKIRRKAELANVLSESLYINIDRKEILNSAIQHFMPLTGLQFALRYLNVTFKEESGIDGG